MSCHLVVGAPHQGKSTYTKRMIENANPKACLICDVQNEYYCISQRTGEHFDHL